MTIPKYVTLTLFVGDSDDPDVVPTWAAAYRELRRRGLDADEARRRINFARTGDMYATRPAAWRQQQRPVGLGV